MEEFEYDHDEEMAFMWSHEEIMCNEMRENHEEDKTHSMCIEQCLAGGVKLTNIY